MLWGPGLWNWHISAMKAFSWGNIYGSSSADFLNAFSHMNLDNPATTIADTRDGGTQNPNAGMITSGSGTGSGSV